MKKKEKGIEGEIASCRNRWVSNRVEWLGPELPSGLGTGVVEA